MKIRNFPVPSNISIRGTYRGPYVPKADGTVSDGVQAHIDRDLARVAKSGKVSTYRGVNRFAEDS
jgi:hypothetical protein